MVRFLIASSMFLTLFAVAAPAAAAKPGRRDSVEPVNIAPTDWPWWRGPNRNGIIAGEAGIPLKWSSTQNVLWKQAIPGRGHGSPTVVGHQVFLATADKEREVQEVLCFDRRTGERLWTTEVHRGGFATKGNSKATLASSSVACDGERVFINFLHDGAVYTTALDRSGQKLWQTKITDYIVHQGYGSSPAIYQSLVLVSADNRGGGAIAALNRATGKIVWRHTRPKVPNYASPIILNVAGRDQLLFTGCDLVSSYDPLSGEKLWEIEGATTECVTSTVTDGQVIITSGGYPKNHMSAVRADGSGEVVWENKTRVYVPSLLSRGGFLFGVTDAGVAMCWKAADGEEVWKHRLGGTFSSSPVMVGDVILVTNEGGDTFLFKADPKAFELIAENHLGDDVFATPTVSDGQLFLRVARQESDRRQEMLYCIGSAEEQ